MTSGATTAARRAPTRLAAALSLGFLIAVAGCASSGSTNAGDPGRRRLHELAAETVFTVVPPGLTQPPATVQTAAHKRPAGFGSGGWQGPSVVASFTTSASPAHVLHTYDAAAAASGWRATAQGAFGVTDRWAKTYPDGTPAYLIVTVVPHRGTWTYQLAASTPAAA